MIVPADSAMRLLPSDQEMCAAIRGHLVAAHPVMRWAADLGKLYRDEPTSLSGDRHCRSDELVLAIDTWVAEHLPAPHPAARLLTVSMGTVIDRLAVAQVHAHHLLLTEPDLAHPRVHDAWFRLGEAVHEYVDLSTGLLQRSLRLPPLGDLR